MIYFHQNNLKNTSILMSITLFKIEGTEIAIHEQVVSFQDTCHHHIVISSDKTILYEEEKNYTGNV